MWHSTFCAECGLVKQSTRESDARDLTPILTTWGFPVTAAYDSGIGKSPAYLSYSNLPSMPCIFSTSHSTGHLSASLHLGPASSLIHTDHHQGLAGSQYNEVSHAQPSNAGLGYPLAAVKPVDNQIGPIRNGTTQRKLMRPSPIHASMFPTGYSHASQFVQDHEIQKARKLTLKTGSSNFSVASLIHRDEHRPVLSSNHRNNLSRIFTMNAEVSPVSTLSNACKVANGTTHLTADSPEDLGLSNLEHVRLGNLNGSSLVSIKSEIGSPSDFELSRIKSSTPNNETDANVGVSNGLNYSDLVAIDKNNSGDESYNLSPVPRIYDFTTSSSPENSSYYSISSSNKGSRIPFMSTSGNIRIRTRGTENFGSAPGNHLMSNTHGQALNFLHSSPEIRTEQRNLTDEVESMTNDQAGRSAIVCNQCGKKYTHESSYRRHLMTHNDVTFACDVKGLKYSRLDCLRRHEKKAHNPSDLILASGLTFFQ